MDRLTPPARSAWAISSVFVALALLGGAASGAYAQTYSVERLIAGASVEVRGVGPAGKVAGSAGLNAFLYDGATVHNLGTLGGVQATPIGINASDEIVGILGNRFVTPSPLRSFYWSPATGMLDIGSMHPAPGGRAVAQAINNAGQIVGASLPGVLPLNGRAFIWSLATGMVDLGGPVGSTSLASAINSAGHVVGAVIVAGQQRAFLWTPAGGMVTLGTLGGTMSSATSINDAGQVVGVSTNAAGQNRAFLWTSASGMEDLGGVGNCQARRISNLGQVLGECARPFVWTVAEGMVSLAFGDFNIATSMNAAGTVVGAAQVAPGQFRAFIYDAATGVRDLNGHLSDSTLSFGRAHSIGDDGTIAAAVFPSFELAILRLAPAEGATPAGANVEVELAVALPNGGTAPVEVTYANVGQAGQTSVVASATGPEPPAGFKLGNPPLVYDVSTTALVSGPIQLCFGWTEGQFANEGALVLLHFRNGAWEDITTVVNSDANLICGVAASLSPFALMEAAFSFSGFRAPIANLPGHNDVRAGAAVPLKFSLGGDKGSSIFAAGYPGVVTISCDSGTPGFVIEETVTAGGSQLSYDPETDIYHYVWKTDKAWAGSCRSLIMRFTDGSEGRANFSFR